MIAPVIADGCDLLGVTTAVSGSVACLATTSAVASRPASGPLPLDTLQVAFDSQVTARALHLPDLFSQALEYPMLGVMGVTEAGLDHPLVQRANARRAVGGDLFQQRDVQPHVQKRIGFAAFRMPVASERLLALLQERLIFGMTLNHIDDLPLNRLQLLAGASLLPGIDELLAQLSTVDAEH